MHLELKSKLYTHKHPVLSPPQLWYFWRRRLFIWISFIDSYFEILLYVSLTLLSVAGVAKRTKLVAEGPKLF